MERRREGWRDRGTVPHLPNKKVLISTFSFSPSRWGDGGKVGKRGREGREEGERRIEEEEGERRTEEEVGRGGIRMSG